MRPSSNPSCRGYLGDESNGRKAKIGGGCTECRAGVLNLTQHYSMIDFRLFVFDYERYRDSNKGE